jgi:hypothetical protein
MMQPVPLQLYMPEAPLAADAQVAHPHHRRQAATE